MTKPLLLKLAALAAAAAPLIACAASREPLPKLPADAGGTPPPVIAADAPLVTRVETIEVDRPLAVVLDVASRPLEAAVQGAGGVPGVVKTRMLTASEFGAPGSRRLVHLSDSSTLVEQVLAREYGERSFLFRYQVWNFQGPSAGKVDFGVGEFQYEALPNDRTRIRWTYSFRLNEQAFPGRLGVLGRGLFRVGFFERGFADMMKGVLRGYKAGAEAQPA